MLGKLLKHEWKGIYKVGCLFLVALLGVSFLGWLAFQSPMWRSLAEDTVYQSGVLSLLDVASVFTLFLYALMLVAASVGIMVYLAIHFYKTMYTDEGYLTHTLPVTKNKLLFSKIFISGIWVMIVTVAVLFSLFGLMNSLIGAVLPESYSLIEFWSFFFNEFGEVLVIAFEEGLGLNLTVYTVYFIINLIISPFVSMIIIFGAISMGQLFTKHRVLMAIVSYFGVTLVSGILGSVVEGIITAAHVNSDSIEIVGSYFNTTLSASSIINIVVAVGMYLISYFVTTKKLNME